MIKYDAVQGVGYVLDGEGDFDESAHPRDEKGQFSVVHSGKDYNILKGTTSGMFYYQHKESGQISGAHSTAKGAAEAAVRHRSSREITTVHEGTGTPNGRGGVTWYAKGAEKAQNRQADIAEAQRRIREGDF